MILNVRKNVLINAIAEAELTAEEKSFIKSITDASSENSLKIDSRRISVKLLSYILKNSPNMANKPKALLSMMLFNETDIETDDLISIWETKIKKLADIVECFSRIGTENINAEIYFNRAWYPVRLVPRFVPATRHYAAHVDVSIKVCFANEYTDIGFSITKEYLTNESGGVRRIMLKEYKYDKTAIKRLFLPPKIANVLDKVFSTPTKDLIGDILDFKHGGMIILASGNPGVGKTSSAEVYSEMQEMPLYSLDISELGTRVESIEQSLSLIFKRVEKWNAIILFDEVDIFLAKRTKNDLNRAAIVGVFLRLMDYFRGVMFLTSNRPKVIDYAIHSRVTLRIDYPDLDYNTRMDIWKDKLGYAGIIVKDGYSDLSKLKLNGRQIRNIIRLINIVLPKSTTQKNIIDVIKHDFPHIKLSKEPRKLPVILSIQEVQQMLSLTTNPKHKLLLSLTYGA